ncbi:glutamine synthetase family protein [Propylenella binzhouense]|uniref:Glutamine synthetase n=1 Tax=Propylenella binzhouense TaxID=2555902 RepID=A0A964T6B1_9HYPH|nr:glutamine synthetase family protein [Propylenella binzhouense]MYZ48207.1 glutamine synthetase [Propylenella binzhouense]
MKGMLSLSELAGAVAGGTIDTVLVCFTDMQGRLIGKRFQAEYFLDGAYEETHACDYLLANDIDMEPVPGYAAANWRKGYGDFVMKPDLSTLRVVPWLPATALVLCDVLDHHTHRPVPHSPRAMLRHQLDRLAAKGWQAFFASELEFYLFDETYETAAAKRYADLRTAGAYIQDYHVLQTTKEEEVMRAIRRGLEAAGIPVENSKGEWGPGQEEINVRYAPALAMADRHVILKNGVKEIAWLKGKAVTFMAKWAYDLAGSSCHIHASLWDRAGERPLFYDEAADFGMSPLMRRFMAGQLRHAGEITWFLAPYVNSYKRFQVGTFAPTKAIWSRDNRTAGFRLCGEHSKAIRTECRIGGADLNPYLAFAALLAAGLAGIEEELELPPPFAGDAYREEGLADVPKTLREAAALMDGSDMLRAAFGDEVVDHYVHTAKWEQFEYDRRITDWELKRGFERY